jgi:ribosome-associated protein
LNLIYFGIACIRRAAIAQTSKATALAIGKAMHDKKAVDVQVLHVAPLTSVADYLVIGSAESDRQTRAIADHIDGTLSRMGQRPLSIEGTTSGQWVLLDFGDVVAHIFRQDVRSHYALERLWHDAKQVPIPEEAPAPATVPKQRTVVRKSTAHKTV